MTDGNGNPIVWSESLQKKLGGYLLKGSGDSAEEIISIRALGRERLPVLSCGLPSHPLKIMFFALWETTERFCLSFLHTSRQMCFQQKPDRRPPQITSRGVNPVPQGGVGAPNELATFRVHNTVDDFVEQSVWRTRNCAASNPRSARQFLRPMLAKIAARNRLFSGILESFKK